MRLTSILQINFGKLKQHKLKAMFLILPITVLMILTVVISSQVQNFQKAAEKSIFGTIETQATLLNLVKTVSFSQPRGGGGAPTFFNSDNQYTSSDIEKISQINNVKSVSINSQVPIQTAVTTDLFAGAKYNLQNVVEIDQDSASLYTRESFEYTEGGVVPIVLNASTFQTQYEDWGGKDEVSVTFSRGSRPGGAPGANPNPINDLGTPIKSKTLEYKKDELIGKSFSVSFGGLDAIASFKVTPGSGAITFTKLTQAELDTKESEQKAAIEKYWDYAKISTPLTYTFKVVGVIESESDTKTYVPTDFADSLLKKYVQNQLDARNTTAIPTDLLNSTYTGMTYDGTQLSSGIGGIRGGGIRIPLGGAQGGNVQIGGPAGATPATASSSYAIPGLVIQLSSDGQQTVSGIVTDTDVYKNSVKTGQSISVKMNSVYDRTQVVKDLNAAGYAYQDINNLDVFNNLRNTLNTVSTALTFGFIILSIAVIIFTMSKFVSESRKEIGIFRAIGVKKSDIVKLFTLQALVYSGIGYIAGAGLGFALNIVSAGFMKSWFESLVLKTVKETFNVVNTVDVSLFSGVAMQTIGFYSIALLLITLLISLIPALKAASVSPVEAIKGE